MSYEQKKKLSEFNNCSVDNKIIKDFITAYEAFSPNNNIKTPHTYAIQETSKKYNISEEQVKKEVLRWIKQNEYEAFLRTLKELVDDDRDMYWLIKHHENRRNKDLLKTTFNGRTAWHPCHYISNIILSGSTISLSDYNNECLNKIAINCNHLFNQSFESIIIIGGVKENNTFEPVFVHDVSKIDSAKLYSFSQDDVASVFKFPKDYEKVSDSVFQKEISKNETFEYKACIDTYELAWKLTSKNCNAFIMVHNHINGDVTPSQPDILTTLKLMKAFATLGIDMIDHIICGRVNEDKVALYSMRIYNDIFKRQKHLDYAFQELDQFSSHEEISEFINKNRYAKWKARKQMDEEGNTIPPEHIIEVEIPKEKEC